MKEKDLCFVSNYIDYALYKKLGNFNETISEFQYFYSLCQTGN